MQALTRGTPKEMLPIAGIPAIEWILRECAASGAAEVLVVSAPGKSALDEHVRRRAGEPGMPARCDVVVQEHARGLADAIRLGRGFASGAPIAVALPDNLFESDRPALAQVIESHERSAVSVVAVAEVHVEEAGRRGPTAILPGRLDGDRFAIEQVPDKGARGSSFDTGGARSAFTAVGRYVFTPELFDIIDEIDRALAPGAELDDIPVMQELLRRGRLVGRRIAGRFYDIGLPGGYAEANAAFSRRAALSSRASPDR